MYVLVEILLVLNRYLLERMNKIIFKKYKKEITSFYLVSTSPLVNYITTQPI